MTNPLAERLKKKIAPQPELAPLLPLTLAVSQKVPKPRKCCLSFKGSGPHADGCPHKKEKP